jgi:crotonobetainyl-CoA:carnitine CoA-transferase CaiB-like acyl-CoA transferase
MYSVFGLWPRPITSLHTRYGRTRKSGPCRLRSSYAPSTGTPPIGWSRLVAKSDVVIENFSARAMTSLDLGYERLHAANARIIYVAMPAFGCEGPYRDYVGFGPGVEPMTGLAAVMGYSDDEPRISATALPDPIAGLAAVAAVVTALERRERTGLGSQIDLSQHEAGIALLGEYFLEHQRTGREPERIGNAHHSFAPHGVYRCLGEDEWITLAARDDADWKALSAVAGRDWAADSRFATRSARLKHRTALDDEISGWTAGFDKFALMRSLLEAGVPAGAVLASREYLADPHLEARGYFADLSHPETGPQRYDGSPLMFNGARGYEQWTPAPRLGEHNAAVLRDMLEMDEAEIALLLADGVIADRPTE